MSSIKTSALRASQPTPQKKAQTSTKLTRSPLKNVSLIVSNYNRYFSSGIYDHRYPHVNRNTLALINQHMTQQPPQAHVLDYGCGDGRYLLPLLEDHPQAAFRAFDIASAPLKILEQKILQQQWIKRVALYDSLETLTLDIKANASIDVALVLFGVFSHIESAKERQQVLRVLREHITPNTGRLILSVPNKARRFIRLQKQQKSHAIHYTRQINQQDMVFYYHLYSVESIQEELRHAGFDHIEARAESLLPESWVTRISCLGRLDQWLCKHIPAHWGYGILLSCQTHH